MSGPRQVPWPRLAIEAGALLATGIGLYVLAGWILRLPQFIAPLADAIPMAPSTAVLFVALGTAVFLRAWPSTAARVQRWLAPVAGAATIMAATLAVTSGQGFFLPAEHLWLPIDVGTAPFPLGHMSPATGILFAACGLSLLALRRSGGRGWTAGRWFAAAVVVAAFALILIYLWNPAPLYGALIVPPAALTSVAFLALGLGLFGLTTWSPAEAQAAGGGERRHPIATYLLVLAAFTVGTVTIGLLTYRDYEERYRDEIARELTAIGDLKASGLESWRQERLGDGEVLHSNRAFGALLERFLAEAQDPAARQELEQWLGSYLKAYGYERVMVLDAAGALQAMLPESDEALSPVLAAGAQAALARRQPQFIDFHREGPQDRVFLAIAAPIFDNGGAGRPLGAVVLRIDPENFVYPFLRQWPTASRTGETLLVRHEGDEIVFLNDLRFAPGSALALRFPVEQVDLPASAAARGESGVVEGVDYRGEPVLAHIDAVQGSPWFLVARLDTEEAFAPLYARRVETVAVVGALLFGVAAGLGLMLRQERAEQQRSQVALRRSQDRLRETMDSMLEGAQLIGFDWRYLYVNDAVAAQGRRPKDELLGRTMVECFPGIERTDMFATLRRCMERREGAQFENEFAFPDGSTGFFELIVQPVPEGLFLLSHDVTERRRAEASARRHADQLEALNRVARIVSGSLELDPVYDGFVAELRHLLPVDRTSITRIDDAGRQWMIARQWTAVEPTLQPGTWHPLDGSVFGEVVRSRSPRLESPIDPEDRWAESPLLRAEGLGSRMIAPLLVKDRVLGTVSAASLKPQAYSPADLELFQTMATHLALAVENVRLYAAEREYTAQLERRVAERTAELQTANQELEAFSYSVSHDLRAPLRAIEGFSRIVQEDYASSLDPGARGYLDRVRASTVRMGRLIDDLLAFSRLGRKDITRRLVAPATLARQALEQLEEDRSDRQVEVVIDDLPNASADPELLRQVFINLLSNALKFTRGRQPARIHVGSSKDNGERAYFVNDNGAGFDMIYAGKLFGVFQRLHRSDEYEGTGVGLAIVQRIIARHGGRTWAEGAVDRGATFYFTLPKGDDA